MRLRASVRAKLSLAFVVILIPLLLFELFTFEQQRRRALDDALGDELRTAEAVGAYVDARFDEALADAQIVATDPVIRSLEPESIQRHLERIRHFQPQYINISVVDARGQQIATAAPQPDVPPLNVADWEYFQRMVATNRPVLSHVVVGRIVQRPIAVAAAPVHDDTGQLTGAALVAVGLDKFGEDLATVPLTQGRDIGLTDSTGRLGFHTMQSELSWEQRDLSGWQPVASALRSQQVRAESVTHPLTGDPRVGAFTPSPRFGWVVFVTLPRDEALAASWEILRSRLLFFSGVFTLSFGLALVLSRLFTQPLNSLVEAHDAVRRGDTSKRVHIRTGDEFEVVAHAFNDMVAQLEQRDKEKATYDRMREEFISIIAHDLRSPITAIAGVAQMLRLAGDLTTLSPRQRRAIDLVESSARRLNRMVDDLLDASRIEAHRLELERVAVVLNHHVQRTVDELMPMLTPHPVNVRPAPGLAVVDADPQRLSQIWTNLLTNAAKFSPPDAPIDVVVHADETHAFVSVVDRGRGIPRDEMPHLFDRYYRVREHRGEKTEGLGLGLYITCGLVQAHGGKIWVDSEVGKGSTFTVELPLCKRCVAEGAGHAA